VFFAVEPRLLLPPGLAQRIPDGGQAWRSRAGQVGKPAAVAYGRAERDLRNPPTGVGNDVLKKAA
jgi:hypothetical protein